MLHALKRIAPEVLVRHVKYARTRLVLGSTPYPEIFRRAYLDNLWRSDESRSGLGSTVAFTAPIRDALEDFLAAREIKSLVDLPCGDFNWMRVVRFPDGMSYLGLDIVPELIEQNRTRHAATHIRFEVGDVLADDLPQADAYFCRDLLIHFPNEATEQALANIKGSGSRYLLATTFPDVTVNVDTRFPDSRRHNLALYLGEPRELLWDGRPGKFIGVWCIE